MYRDKEPEDDRRDRLRETPDERPDWFECGPPDDDDDLDDVGPEPDTIREARECVFVNVNGEEGV